MHQKEAILLGLLFAISLVSAVTITDLEPNDITNEYVQLYQEQPINLNGKIIEFIDDGVNEAYIKVDGTRGTIIASDFVYINGASVKLLNIWEKNQYRELSIEVNITFYGSCGDGICHDREICCKDCGCGSGNICIDNQCILNTSNKCIADLECLDMDTCTWDVCTGVPRKCEHRSIIQCKSGDGCCAAGCTANNDKDCANLGYECNDNSQCDDKNDNTIDKCSGITYKCYHTTINESQITINPESNYKSCTLDVECEDNNECTRDFCRNQECTYGYIENCVPKIIIKEPSVFNDFLRDNYS